MDSKHAFKVGDVVNHNSQGVLGRVFQRVDHRCGVVYIFVPGTTLPSWLAKLGPENARPPAHIVSVQYLIRGTSLFASIPSGLPCPKRHYAWVGEKTLSKAKVHLEDFPIMSLPLPVLAGVFRQLPISEGALLCLTCKKLVAAFRDEATWKQRCAEESVRLGIPVDLSKPSTSYFLTYQKFFVWSVEVVTLFGHRAGYSISGRFTCTVFPTMTVKAFEEVITNDPANRQHSAEGVIPHNPGVVRHRSQPVDPTTKPNCQYDNSDPNATIASVGICNGAVLEIRERMMRD